MRKQNIKRIIPLSEVAKSDYYNDMAELALIFNHQIIEDEHGTWRWKQNDLMALLMDDTPIYLTNNPEDRRNMVNGKSIRANLDLNALYMDLLSKKFSVEERMKFYMQIGYSLSGFSEVFGQHEASEYDLPGAKTEPEDENSYAETVIDYMRRIYENDRVMV